jgi:hypothetical protein
LCRCGDGARNGDETDVDCGGQCGPCVEGLACLLPGDCTSHVCGTANHTCSWPSCGDGVQNGNETDVDCGGATCTPCSDGLACQAPSDCASMVCNSSTHQCVPASCADNVKNGNETDQDCGGPLCQPCPDAKHCGVPSDCASHVCNATQHLCSAPTCSDGFHNGNESDVDCGGPCPVGCSDQAACRTGSDCRSGDCHLGLCRCGDGARNGDETDVDCGGQCGPCVEGLACLLPGDCTSHVCDTANHTCSWPSCGDGVQNGNETDVDCGGATCTPCVEGLACLLPGDCTSHVCGTANHTCTWPSCSDGVQNGNETDIDCGGGSCSSCSAHCPTNITIELPAVSNLARLVVSVIGPPTLNSLCTTLQCVMFATLHPSLTQIQHTLEQPSSLESTALDFVVLPNLWPANDNTSSIAIFVKAFSLEGCNITSSQKSVVVDRVAPTATWSVNQSSSLGTIVATLNFSEEVGIRFYCVLYGLWQFSPAYPNSR